MKYFGLIIPRSYNDYFSRSDPAAFQHAVSKLIDAELSTESENAVQNKAIAEIVPPQATSSNQLADKEFVNSSIATATANFRGTFNSTEELEAYAGPLTNNDYAFVIAADTAGNRVYNRYKYNGTGWVFEYALNNSAFTSEQWAAINSGMTAELVQLMSADYIFNLTHPVGEVYVQLPTQTDPQTLYGRGTWEDISVSYAGLFFRAAGGNAKAFDGSKVDVQDDALQGHTHAESGNGHSHNATYIRGSSGSGAWAMVNRAVQETKDFVSDTAKVSLGNPIAYNNGTPRLADETRPKNTTVKIWKRTA